ncbi:ATP-binding protein [Streptomyces lydicus]|uniref:ATP-binding protein n=1 Tax=Streptomyces lydicus TaxID=47763 RepID=UPI0036EF048D
MPVTATTQAPQPRKRQELRALVSAPWRAPGGAPPLTMDPPRTHAFALSVDDSSAAVARRSSRENLRDWGLPTAVLDDVQLIISELVTNAVQHAGSLTDMIFVTQLEDRHGGLMLGVRDNHPAIPHAEPLIGLLGCGRGLNIVLALVADAGGQCGVQQHEHGSKTVWVRLPGVFA